jgi:lysozyme family protein
MPGVAAVLTRADMDKVCTPWVGVLAHFVGLKSAPQGPLAGDRACWQGEPVALVCARSRAEAEDAAAEHIRRYTDPVAMLSVVPAVQFALRDAAFNRGPSGAVKILQDALGLPADGIVGPKTKEALQGAERDPKKLLSDLRGARERYERRTRDESSKFWAGLSNRWDRQHADSLTMLA